MLELLKTYFRELADLVNQMAPYLLLGFFFAGVLRVLFPKKMISRYMGQGNFRSALNASLLGVPMPLCSCGVLPTGIGFYRNGASRGSTVSFLISTPQTGVDSIIATYAMLGLPFALIRPVVALVTGVAGGVLGNLTDRNHRETRPLQEDKGEEYPKTVRELFRYGFVELLQDISKWLIIGMLVAAFLAVLIPADFFTHSISNEYLAMLIMLAASVPLYICATGSIPIAAVLLLKGLSPGAALVLLMAGPATNFATMAVIGHTMGRRTLWVYLSSIVGGALLFGTLINEFIPREWITGAIPGGMSHAMHTHPAGWLQWLFSAVLVLLILNGYFLKIRERRRHEKENRSREKDMTKQIYTFRVEGMTCNHCKATVERGLGSLEGISSATADPDRNLVSVEAETLSEESVRDTVEGLGYVFKGRIFRL
jgi:uncharacterized membrane protein YraQ (UPF0718 family)/copper chaperone CopZ